MKEQVFFKELSSRIIGACIYIHNSLGSGLPEKIYKNAIYYYLNDELHISCVKEQGFDVEALHFNLPFGCGCCDLGCNLNFTQMTGVKMSLFDVTKGDLLKEYLKIIKSPKYGTGTSVNPCKDCKIFMFRQLNKFD